jgi:hypothetical protein
VDDPRQSIATMTDILHRWLTDDQEYARQKSDLASLCDEVATPGATENAARAILERLAGGASQVRRAA